LSTKIHAVVDAVGLPVRLLLTPGQASDKTTLPSHRRLEASPRGDRRSRLQRRSIIDLFAMMGTTAHIPSQSNVRIVRTVNLQRYASAPGSEGMLPPLEGRAGRYLGECCHRQRDGTKSKSYCFATSGKMLEGSTMPRVPKAARTVSAT
jgi:hypothetical protein